MTKSKVIYLCSACNAQHLKWSGQCIECGAWNTITEEVVGVAKKNLRNIGWSNAAVGKIAKLSEIGLDQQSRFDTCFGELNRVLGSGIVAGSVILIGGDPGIGKSTLLLQCMCNMSKKVGSLYITGEESLQQVAFRAKRLGVASDDLEVLASTQIEQILTVVSKMELRVIVIDSIQSMFTECLSSAPGSISQVRESAAQLVQYAKQTGVALFIIGHVTREGTIAGPRVLEHMVDTVLYFEGDCNSRYRIIRAVKNRFGAVNEIGVFAMTDKGLREVSNPSAIFLSRYKKPVEGSIVMATWEGTRPLLVEVQALVDESHLANPRRVSLGLEQNRLSMLLAVLHRHCNIVTYNQDVFINIVGGIRMLETAADLAILLAVVSSLNNYPLSEKTIVFGEIGLSGEIRPVQNGQDRLHEAVKHGFTKAIIPAANKPKQLLKGLEIVAVSYLSEALSEIFNQNSLSS